MTTLISRKIERIGQLAEAKPYIIALEEHYEDAELRGLTGGTASAPPVEAPHAPELCRIPFSNGSMYVGEGGTVAVTPTVMNAILDALAPLGVTDIPMSATSERVWRVIHG